MSKKTDSPSLKCASCGHENEPERVYCHNCGSKLDRTLLPKAEDTKDGESKDADLRRIKKMMNPRRAGAGFNDVKIGIQVVIFAIIVAAMFLLWQKPDSVPESRKDYLPARPAAELWDLLMGAKTANSITISQDDMNASIKNTLKAGEGAAGIKFVRAVVELKPGIITVFVERDVWGLSLYSSVTYKPVVKDGKIAGEIVDIHMGRLGIHPAGAGAVANWCVSGIWNAYDKEIKQADRLAEIKVEDGKILFISKPL